ncbi:MAG: 4Fe-4S binding protein [Dehalogenimonas sp.]
MCEFCTEHGEGKKWYLQVKNYTDEMLHQELSQLQKDTINAQSRAEWVRRFWQGFTFPAYNGVQPIPRNKVFGTKTLEGDKIEHFGQIIPIEDVERVIDLVSSITRMPCGCRYISTGKTDKRYCFGVHLDHWGSLGTYPDSASSLEGLTKQEAKKIIRAYDEEGLIHSIWTGVTPYVIGICNCDHDCLAYRGYIEKGGQPSFFRAEYVCRVNEDLCNGCKLCMSQCQFGAQFYSSAMSRVHISAERCFGCGVCRASCPTDAIELIPRAAHAN